MWLFEQSLVNLTVLLLPDFNKDHLEPAFPCYDQFLITQPHGVQSILHSTLFFAKFVLCLFVQNEMKSNF
jgi:hypothetical protein